MSDQPAPGQLRQQDVQDEVTDVYKLGLAILRCLTPGKGAASSRSATRLAAELDAEGIALVTRAVRADRGGRPTAKELYGYFYRFVLARIKPPEVLVAKLVTPFDPARDGRRLEWRIENAQRSPYRPVTASRSRWTWLRVPGAAPSSQTGRGRCSSRRVIATASLECTWGR